MRWPSIVVPFLLVGLGVACAGSNPSTPESLSKLGANRPGVAEVASPQEGNIVAGQTVYVPACSHVYTADNGQPLNLASTLFVRNVDQGRSIILTRVQYVDSGGKALRQFLTKPLKLDPMASMDFFVKESDTTGGASPSFLVEWVASEPAIDPIVESVMIGTSGTQGISFTGAGRVIGSRKP